MEEQQLDYAVIVAVIIILGITYVIYHLYYSQKTYNIKPLSEKENQLLPIHYTNMKLVDGYHYKCDKFYRWCKQYSQDTTKLVKELPEIGLSITYTGYVFLNTHRDYKNMVHFMFLEPEVFDNVYHYLFEYDDSEKLIQENKEINNKFLERIKNKNG